MPMVFGSKASAQPGSGTSITIAKPSGTVEGDVLVAMVSARENTEPAFSAPTGWTSRGFATTSAATRTQVWTKVAGASEPANYTWNLSLNANQLVGAILRYTPQSPTLPPGVIDAAAMAGSDTSPAVAPSVTATGDNDTLLALFSGATVGSAPDGMTQREAIDGANVAVFAYDEILSLAGATGDRTWTGSGFGRGWTIALLANQGGSRIRMMI